MLPHAAPIRVTGPSYPAEPPEPTVSTEATDFIGTTAEVMYPPFWWYARIALSVPRACSSLAKRLMRRCPASAPSAGRKSMAQRRPSSQEPFMSSDSPNSIM